MSDFDRVGNGWSGSIGGMCPVQGEGVCDGKPWYFRARGDRWTIWFAERADADPVDVGHEEGGWYAHGKWGEWPEAGYMPIDVAWGLIEHAIGDSRAGNLARVEPQKPMRPVVHGSTWRRSGL